VETLDTAGGCIAGAALATTRLRRALDGEARRGGQEERDEEGMEAAAVAGAARGRRVEIAAREVDAAAGARREEAVAAMGWSGRETATATTAVVVSGNSDGVGI